MEHIAAFILIVGCSEDLSQCRELPAPQPIFETMQDCESDLPYSFDDFVGAHPQLFAQCFAVDPMLAETDAQIVWDVTQDGKLTASVEPIGVEEVLVASTQDRGAEEAVTQR